MIITKKNISIRCLKPVFIIFLVIGIFIIPLGFFVAFPAGMDIAFILDYMDYIYAYVAITVEFLVISYVSMVAPRLLKVRRMEKVLGINVEKMLEGKRIRFEKYIDDDWFIFITGGKFILLNRRYIKRIRKTEYGRYANFDIYFETCDGKNVKWNILSYYNADSSFREWIKKGRG